MTTHQQPNESKDAQQKGWHEFRFFRSIPIRVNGLRPDRIMANDRDPIQVLSLYLDHGRGAESATPKSNRRVGRRQSGG